MTKRPSMWRGVALVAAACALLLLNALADRAAAQSRASAPPDGEYALVDTVVFGGPFVVDATSDLPGYLTVPIYTHLTVEGDLFRFAFRTPIQPDPAECEMAGRCQVWVEALELRVGIDDDGRLEILDVRFDDGPGMVIDRAGIDLPYIIEPLVSFIRGASLAPAKHGFLLTRVGPGGETRAARFLPASRPRVDDAIAFSLIFDVPLTRQDRCVLRRVLELDARGDTLTENEATLLAATRAAGAWREHYAVVAQFPAEDRDDPAYRRALALNGAGAYAIYGSAEVLNAVDDLVRDQTIDRQDVAGDADLSDIAPDIAARLTQSFDAALEEYLARRSFASAFEPEIRAWTAEHRDGLLAIQRYLIRWGYAESIGVDVNGAVLCSGVFEELSASGD